jgi:hypothetical protein
MIQDFSSVKEELLTVEEWLHVEVNYELKQVVRRKNE